MSSIFFEFSDVLSSFEKVETAMKRQICWFFLMPVLLSGFIPLVNLFVKELTSVKHKVHDPASSLIVVTGAGSGVGLAMAMELAARGYTVLAGARKERQMREMENQAKEQKFKGELVPVMLDVTSGQHVQMV